MQIPDNTLTIAFKDQYFDLKGLSMYSRLSVSSLRHHIKSNDLPIFTVAGPGGKAGKILVKRSEFDNWMESTWRKEIHNIDSIVNDVMEGLGD
jgi:hypothetical protein